MCSHMIFMAKRPILVHVYTTRVTHLQITFASCETYILAAVALGHLFGRRRFAPRLSKAQLLKPNTETGVFMETVACRPYIAAQSTSNTLSYQCSEMVPAKARELCSPLSNRLGWLTRIDRAIFPH